jgi:DNA invertase Pin-like site-specific DNA recombinase
MRAALYVRVSTRDQQTLGMQVDAMTAYVEDRGWRLARRVEDVGSGAKERRGRESLLRAARRREVDVILVWRLGRWGRSVADLMTTLRELTELGIGFMSLTEALDLTTPSGRATASLKSVEIARLKAEGRSHSEIARRLGIGRTSGRRAE